jgi:hypothetical protein
MQSGQVSVWVPIAVGFIGVLGVIAGQLVTTWRDRSREAAAARRADQIYWRDKRLDACLALLLTMNAWRELTVDTWHGTPSDTTLAELHDAAVAMSDQLATLKLIGTDPLRQAATTAVDDLRAIAAAVRKSPATTDLTQAARTLTATITTLRTQARTALAIP